MKIVVTGGLGHIGSRLIRELPKWLPGAEILIVDNMSAQRYCSLFNLPASGRYRFVEGDVTKIDLAALLDGARAVFHLAALTNAAASFEVAQELERNNFTATDRVAHACTEAQVPLIYLSSTSVYGTQGEVVDEDCSAEELKPQSPYAETKLKEEALLSELGTKEGLRFVVCRFGTIFGTSPGMRFHTAVNKFCWQAALGQPITVWRTALAQKRPYLDLGDAMSAFKLILDKGLFDRRIYNILTANLTVGEIVAVIKEHAPDLSIELVDTKIMNQLSYEVLDKRFREQGFVPNGDIRKAVAETMTLLRGARISAQAGIGRA